ncbi:hypothetical protein BJ508DRAFT_322529 [Ascobolus immersus RN42]|uniref:PH domain-containing protein n=1 Tax=Ascobolus immersus RN42 TaxID=1160509 RepID=A0A3N4IL97_ASCIM|nr:hypothetical protein BJ508DRAFT_322529 [Ascobolus immersus RN42]
MALPSNQQDSTATMDPNSNGTGSQQPLLLVLHDFEARSPDEISLAKGEMVELLIDDSEFGDGWYTPLPADYYPQSTDADTQSNDPTPTTSTAIPQQHPEDHPEGAQDANRSTGSSESFKKLTASTTDDAAPVAQTPQPTEEQSADLKKETKANPFGRISTQDVDISPPSTPPLAIGGDKRSSSATVSDRPPSSDSHTHIKSPVIEDTLSDIEEAISDFSNNPRNSRNNGQMKEQNSRHSTNKSPMVPQQPPIPEVDADSDSDYSKYEDQTISSDEEDETEEEVFLTEDKVREWSALQVSAYMQENGVAREVAKKFEEQEVSGSILLELEMAHLKELELGSFGRRFQVWKVIEDLHAQINASTLPMKPKPLKRSGSEASSNVPGLLISEGGGNRQRSSTVGSARFSTTSKSSKSKYKIDVEEANNRTSNQWLLHTPGTAGLQESGSPATSLFEKPRSPPKSPPQQYADGGRRAASTDGWNSAHNSILQGAGPLPTHNRDSSFDRDWNPGSVMRPGTATGTAVPRKENDASYFSGGEGKDRKVLRKGHTKKPSHSEEHPPRSGTSHSRHSRMGSSEGSSLLPETSILGNAAKALMGNKRKSSNSFSSDKPFAFGQQSSPRLGPQKRGTGDHIENSSIQSSPALTGSPQRALNYGNQVIGSPTSMKNVEFPGGDSAVSSPSITTVDSDPARTKDAADKEDRRLRSASSASALSSTKAAKGTKTKKTKKRKGSGVEGLREITPAQAAADADFSGWMKKRGSGTIASTWKARYFVLKGRRLSYFYSEKDTKERGVIDITGHRVLPAADDKLVAIHATFAAATSPSTPPAPKSPASPSSANAAPKPPPRASRSWFTFKLVPPGKHSQFETTTPKRLHYLAVDTPTEGKSWMAAILKATIERDESKPVISSYNQKTISLEEAQELRARPPEHLIKGTLPEIDLEAIGLAIEGLGKDGLAKDGTGVAPTMSVL